MRLKKIARSPSWGSDKDMAPTLDKIPRGGLGHFLAILILSTTCQLPAASACDWEISRL